MPFGLNQGVYRVTRASDGSAMVTPLVCRGRGPRRPRRPGAASAGARRVRARRARDRWSGTAMSRRVVAGAAASCARWRRGSSRRTAYLHFTFASAASARLKWDARRCAGLRPIAERRASPRPQFQAALRAPSPRGKRCRRRSIAFQFVGFTSAEPFEDDGLSVLGFQAEPDHGTGARRDGVRRRHRHRRNRRVRRLLQFRVRVVDSGLGRRRTRFDLAVGGRRTRSATSSVSAIRRSAKQSCVPKAAAACLASGAVMFPISLGRGIDGRSRTLQPDDIAGVSDLYPDGDFRASTGAVRGRVLRDGRGVIGAHVVAFNPQNRRAHRRLLARRRRRVPDCRALAGRARHPRGAARRCRRRQLLLERGRRRRLPGDLSPAAVRGAGRAASASAFDVTVRPK